MSKENETRSLTLGNTTYRTGGNILFSVPEEGSYYLAESEMLDKMDSAIQKGILVNGMQSLIKKVRG